MDRRQKNKLMELTELAADAIKGPPLDSLLNRLFSKSIITLDMLEQVANQIPTKRVMELHSQMMNCGPGSFEGYYKALMKSEDAAMMDVARHMEDWLDPKYATPLPRDNLNDRVVSLSNEPPQIPNEWPPTPYEPENMSMTECSITDVLVRRHLLDKEVYPLPYGQAIIINNKKFIKSAERMGTDMDRDTMQDTLQGLGLRVHVVNERRGQEILKDIEDAAKNRHSDECFVCVILSHGYKGGVLGVDEELVTLKDIFVAAKTKPDVPKVFIIQACQGNVKMGEREPEKDHSVQPGSEGDASGPESSQLHMDVSDYIDDEGTNQLDSLCDKDFHSHRFVAMATVPGYVAWRHKNMGSWFIQAVVYALKTWAYCEDICGIFTKVNQLVGRRGKQVSITRSTLKKKLYFFPGITDRDVQKLRKDGNF